MNKEQMKEFNIFKNKSYEIAKADDCVSMLQILEDFNTKYGTKPPIDWLAFMMRYNIKSGHTNVLKLILEKYYHQISDRAFIHHPYKYAIKYKNKDAMLILESIGFIYYDYGLILAKSVFDENEFAEFCKRVIDRVTFNDADNHMRPEKLVNVNIESTNVYSSLHVYSDEMYIKFSKYIELNIKHKKIRMPNNKTTHRLFYISLIDTYSNKSYDSISLVNVRNIEFVKCITIDDFSKEQLEIISNIRKLNKPSINGLFKKI